MAVNAVDHLTLDYTVTLRQSGRGGIDWSVWDGPHRLSHGNSNDIEDALLMVQRVVTTSERVLATPRAESTGQASRDMVQ